MLGSYTTVGRVLSELAGPMGTTERSRQLSLLNDLRRRMYTWFAQRHHIPDIVMCFEVQNFTKDCHDCYNTYSGITLPYDMQNIEGIWENDRKINIYNSWKTWDSGIDSCPSACSIFGEVQPENFATEQDPTYTAGGVKVKFQIGSREDHGKVVSIKYKSPDGVSRFEKIKLDIDSPNRTQFSVMSKLIAGDITLPMDLCGEVIISECSDSSKILSRYNHREHVPSYRRVRLSGLRAGCSQVNVRASRRFSDVCFDEDVIETDNMSFLYEGILWVVSRRKTTRNGRDINDSKDREQELQRILFGEKVREHSAGIIRQVNSNVRSSKRMRRNNLRRALSR